MSIYIYTVITTGLSLEESTLTGTPAVAGGHPATNGADRSQAVLLIGCGAGFLKW